MKVNQIVGFSFLGSFKQIPVKIVKVCSDNTVIVATTDNIKLIAKQTDIDKNPPASLCLDWLEKTS